MKKVFFSISAGLVALLCVMCSGHAQFSPIQVKTYRATVEAVNDCAEGFIRISMKWSDSPHYHPGIVFKQAPKPVTECAALGRLSEEIVRSAHYVDVIYSDGKYFVVPPRSYR